MKLLFSSMLALLTASPALAQDATLELGRTQTEAFFAGELEPIWDDMTPDMREALGTLEDFEAFRAQLEADIGTEDTILDEDTSRSNGMDIYTRTGQWSDVDAPVVVQWAFDGEENIAGFVVQPQAEAAQSNYLDYETQADLRLPFDGEWTVFWGGRTVEQNYHAANAAQRFAIDLVVERDGATYDGDAANMENYHCWGEEILAPADGLVVATIHDLPDQPIGSRDPQNPAGNHVILALGEEEYAFLAHLQQSSVRVQQGDEVATGDVLGLCGNSGNTSEPHLHFHLQNTPDLTQGEGLPAQFQNYLTDGEPVERGELEQGQVVAPSS